MDKANAEELESTVEPAVDFLPISVRAYVQPEPPNKRAGRISRTRLEPSEYALVFDTETTNDAGQTIRFGAYQERKNGNLIDAGVFYDPGVLAGGEQALLRAYAIGRDLKMLTLDEFIEEVLYGFAYNLRATVVGLNLPFDLSRLAKSHGSARRTMRGGFSFRLSNDPYRPRVQVKHRSSRDAFIQFAESRRQHTGRSGRQRGRRVPARRGYFVDVKILGAALLSQSHSLASLARCLGTPHQKLDAHEHGRRLTEDYLKYAVNDVQVTWECFTALKEQYDKHGLGLTPMHSIHSEASIGKAYLKQMGIRPWREVQPDFPAQRIDTIMRTYYGARSEVHLRRVISQVLYCDFLSMYPTVCTLMGLWRYVIANGVTWRYATKETRELIAKVGLADLQQQEFWKKLPVLVQLAPDQDLLPVRARYGGDAPRTIGLNYLTSTTRLWYTLADCIASKLLTGRAPIILKAIRFAPKVIQKGLAPAAIAGNSDYLVDPVKDDFFRRLIDLRSDVRKQQQACDGAKAAQLDAEQSALKILANATSYGIYVELNVEEQADPITALRFDGEGEASPIRLLKLERPGAYFHPLLGTLITGAARLMLAMTERLVIDAGLDWAFCDTDSMAIAKPQAMSESDFFSRAQTVVDWFAPLNPYAEKGPLLKIEDENYGLLRGRAGKRFRSLYCLAVSAKRNVLFNLDCEGRPVIRKASAHGLGHLLAPYEEREAPASIPTPTVPLKDIGIERWQYDLWYRIIEAVLDGRPAQPKFGDFPGLDRPAVSRYGATTPTLLRWFRRYNEGKPYRQQVKPFNFLLAFQARPVLDAALPDGEIIAQLPASRSSKVGMSVRPVSPFDTNRCKAVRKCFDRMTGARVRPEQLKTYREALAQYHLHPEAKFLDANYLDRGPTKRRHIQAMAINLIGKEADQLEEQVYLGVDPEAEIDYGLAGADEDLWARVRQAIKTHGLRAVSRAAGVSRQRVSAMTRRSARVRIKTKNKIARGIAALDAAHTHLEVESTSLLDDARRYCAQIGLRCFAKKVGMNPGSASRMLSLKRPMTGSTVQKLMRVLRPSHNGPG